MTRRFITFLILILIVGGFAAWALVTRARVLAAPEQPITYSHRVHVQAGIQCLFCHPNTLRSSLAGIPSTEKCMGCHNVIATDSPIVQELTNYWDEGKPIPWVRVSPQPDYVYYSHQPHLSAGLNCETCHGDVGQMDITQPFVKMDMGWCLDCHLEQPETKIARLTDCLICHK